MAKTNRHLGRPKSSLSAETRERIVAAGEKCFGLQGYDKTTIKDIADEAGLTTGALYHYFDSKQGLFVAVLVEEQTRVLTNFREAADEVDGAIAKLCAVLERASQLHKEDEYLARFVSIAPIELERHPEFREAMGGGPLAHSGGVGEFFGGIVIEGQRTGEIDPAAAPADVVNMLLSATSGLAQLAGLLGDPAAHRGAIDTFAQLLSGTLMRPHAVPARPSRPSRPARRARAAG